MCDRNNKVCRFCQKTIYSNEFYEMEKTTREMLEALHFHLNLEDERTVMCTECATKLQNAYDFKSTCVNMEKKILPFIISEEDEKLKEDSFREYTNAELIDGSEEQKVCRFCMEVTGTGCYTFLHEKKEHVFLVDMVQKYIPELHLSDTEEVVTCEACLIALQSFLNFITDCLDMEEKTQDMDETVENRLGLNDVKEFKLKYEFNDINITMEEKFNNYEDDITVKNETSLKLDNPELLIKDEETESFQDTACSSRLNLINRKIRKESLKENRRSSHGISKVRVFKCEKCSYDTNQKCHLTQHMVVHENFSETTLYKCGTCLFHTKFKRNLKRHRLLHQDFSDVRVYECETCSYQTKFKDKLKEHRLIHQNLSDEKMYKCEMCSYKTKFKSNLKKHMVVHQNVSDITIYKCEKCSYQSKYKPSHKRHLRLHQDLSDVVVYKCATCSYLTRYKDALGKHMRMHQKLTDSTMLKC